MIYTKTAKPGCGKTKWLLERTNEALHSNKYSALVFIGTSEDYTKFCDKYLAMFGEVPHIDFGTTEYDGTNFCLLIDDIFTYTNTLERYMLVHKLMNAAIDSHITIDGETICICKGKHHG